MEQIVDDVADAPGTLPLLQYALTEVFAARRSDELTHQDYRAVGGVLGALGSGPMRSSGVSTPAVGRSPARSFSPSWQFRNLASSPGAGLGWPI